MTQPHPDNHARLNRNAAIASVSAALLLLCLKAYAEWATASVAMLGSLADTALDLFASLMTLFSVRYAAMPADAAHRFGHGKAEALAALFQVVLITLSAAFIGWRALERIASGDTTARAEYGIIVSVVAIAVTLALLAYQRRVIRQTESVAIEADHVHYQSDLLLNLAVIAALALDQYVGITGIDPAFGVAIALWLAWGAWRAATRAIDQLMDREWPEEKRLAFVEVAARHPELKSLHDLRTRTSGNRNFVQFHVDMDPDMTVRQAHDVIEKVELDLGKAFPGTEILVHIDPLGHVDEPDNPLTEQDELENLKDS
ncbi:cation diffusion facilitator family transporter [Sphingorhabdus sp. Alg239-R122]|uniref:cation diffusion facilitator family transporter n=1 Tax=Sphingorhabdus sp. Alg239-R122 TaxID=2305989 RepID=UPI0013DA5224|nr:cation diffusion facilitator family transporter [Sphingorhabdus sp. Alg239-R122]